jgi:hypothetical protein
MIEAVNSVVSNAPLVRIAADQVNVARSFAANPDRVQEAAGANLPKAPYISPFISWDTDYGKAVLQIRDSQSGEVVTQFPSETRLRAQLASTPADQSFSAPKQAQKTEADIPDAPQVQAQQAQVAQAQVAAAALAKGAQASLPQIATVVTSA